MKSREMSSRDWLQTVATALALGLAGYVLAPLVGVAALQAPAAFALGLALGGVLVVVLGALRMAAPAVVARAEDGPGGGQTPTADAEAQQHKSVFVGNLAFKVSGDELKDLFARYGTVHNVRIMVDRATRRPRGFGFVEMDEAGAEAAIKALDGADFHGRTLRVNEGSDRRGRPGGGHFGA